MAKTPKNPKKPGKTPKSKALRPDVQPIGPALAELLNPAINRGDAGVGSTTGMRVAKSDASSSPPSAREARGGEGSGVGGATAAPPPGPPLSPTLPHKGGGSERAQAEGEKNSGLQPPPDNSKDRRSGGEAAVHRARASTRGSSEDVAKRDASAKRDDATKRDDASSPPPAREARGGEGSGVGGGAANSVPERERELAEPPPTPDPSPPLRGGRGADGPGFDEARPGFDEAPQREFAPANYGTSATIPPLDPELARQLGFTTEEEDAAAMARPPRNKMEALGVAATADALEALIRDGRPEFRGEDGQVKIWTPHRPPRPEKSEGGQPFVIKSEYEPKGDQPTAIAELVEGIGRNDRTQVLLGVTGSGKTYTMAKVIEATQRPALILAPNKTLAAQLYGEF